MVTLKKLSGSAHGYFVYSIPNNYLFYFLLHFIYLVYFSLLEKLIDQINSKKVTSKVRIHV